jgi:hypothetical protein
MNRRTRSRLLDTGVGHDRRAQLRLALSWILLGITRLLIVSGVPARRLVGDDGAVCLLKVSPQDQRRARRIGNLIQLAANCTPWRSECYPQALTARAQLRLARIPHTVSFGLRRAEDGQLVAHAWVMVGETAVVGGDSAAYTVVRSFPWPQYLPDITPQYSPDFRMSHGKLRLLRPHAAKRDRAA